MNQEAITEAILTTGCAPLALEEGAALVDHWIAVTKPPADILGVECGFVYWLDTKTAVIGVQDLLTREPVGIVGNEWKTTKERSRYWGPEKWVTSITEGSQLPIYALALQQGTYYEEGRRPFRPEVREPRIRVRAVSKSTPPEIWPPDRDEIVTFSPERLEATRRGLIAKAASIRALRRVSAPWQLPGIWCVNQFRRQCEYYDDCINQRGPDDWGVFDPGDPAFLFALPYIPEPGDPELVILGASMYSAVSECAEKYRRGTLKEAGLGDAGLQVGTVFHAGVSAWYRQLREEQETAAICIESTESAEFC